MTLRLCILRFSWVVLLLGIAARADVAPFDLSGPQVEVWVTRAGKTLPIAEVPNLQTGDKLWLHPELPPGQSVHYLLIAVFLRGSTNPPPENWFTKIETWNKAVEQDGVTLTVPDEAQQALLFLAPETSGDFGSVRAAVRGRPGAFVRASQDLVQAGLDRSRLDKYLSAIKEASDTDPKALHDRSLLLARSLNIKLDQQCFQQPSEQQAACLSQKTDDLVLDDGHSQSMVAALTSGPSSDLIGQLGTTRAAGGGYYSPYIGAIVDIGQLLGSLHSPEYKYIPALSMPKQDQLNLKLNNPPSFRKPMSVIVVGLPAVEASQLPPIRPVDVKQVYCLQEPSLVLAATGAPLVFSTSYAHNLKLEMRSQSGKSMEVPLVADPSRGGFVVDVGGLSASDLAASVEGRLHGYWGFQTFEGPVFSLRNAHSATWSVSPVDQNALIVGRNDLVHLQSESAICVSQVTLKNRQGTERKLAWKLSKPDELEVQVPLTGELPGPLTMLVKQTGVEATDPVPMHTYSEEGHLDHFKINAGDGQGVLLGTRLDEVASVDLAGIHFIPASLSRADQRDELRLSVSPAPATVALEPNQQLVAHVALKDGRLLDIATTVEPPRPKLSLLSKSIESGPSPSSIRLGNKDELPQEGRLSFFLKTEEPATFPRSEKIEVATADESASVLLSFADGGLVLQDAATLQAVLEPLKSFGPSVFGPLVFRAVQADGAKGDWHPLAVLVRLPSLKEIRCPDSPDEPCALSGSNLFLIDSVASDSQFKQNIPVPAGYGDSTLRVPRPNGTLLYLKLRDDPATVSRAVLTVVPSD
jgi:hypothetical protein